MKRVIEKLAHERKQKEDDFSNKLEDIKKKSKESVPSENFLRLQNLLSRLEEILKPEKVIPSKKSRFFAPLTKSWKREPEEKLFSSQTYLILKEIQNTLENNLNQIKKLLLSLTELIELHHSLTDAKDKEWDALGSNHVGMIFKSMEWRVDKLAAEYEDVKILMKKFLILKEKLNRLFIALEDKKAPPPSLVKELLEPLEDWRYAGFENRFRGSEEEVKNQQGIFLSYFKEGRKVLDLGCGRGEFLELLEEKGVEAEGIEINEEMIEICRGKGLNCQKGDILKKLSEYEDGSLGGIFSSQVIEHLPPQYLRRMVELSYFKLAPSSYLVLETINPASVFSLVQIYLLDLSHQKPIHPQALKFLLESDGFEEVEIKYSSPLQQERLQELPTSDELTSTLNQNIDKLNKLLYAPANYAAIGLKT